MDRLPVLRHVAHQQGAWGHGDYLRHVVLCRHLQLVSPSSSDACVVPAACSVLCVRAGAGDLTVKTASGRSWSISRMRSLAR
jgi:hypothetical protein